MDDDDLFFDARQDLAVEVSDRSLDDCHTDTSTHSGIAELRGGAASGSGSSGGFGGAHDDGDYFQGTRKRDCVYDCHLFTISIAFSFLGFHYVRVPSYATRLFVV